MQANLADPDVPLMMFRNLHIQNVRVSMPGLIALSGTADEIFR